MTAMLDSGPAVPRSLVGQSASRLQLILLAGLLLGFGLAPGVQPSIPAWLVLLLCSSRATWLLLEDRAVLPIKTTKTRYAQRSDHPHARGDWLSGPPYVGSLLFCSTPGFALRRSSLKDFAFLPFKIIFTCSRHQETRFNCIRA
jgi:hypothetical protein